MGKDEFVEIVGEDPEDILGSDWEELAYLEEYSVKTNALDL